MKIYNNNKSPVRSIFNWYCKLVLVVALAISGSLIHIHAQDNCDYEAGDISLTASGHNAGADYTQVYALADAGTGNIVQLSNTADFTAVAAGIYDAYAINYKTSNGVSNLALDEAINSLSGDCLDVSAPFNFEVCEESNGSNDPPEPAAITGNQNGDCDYFAGIVNLAVNGYNTDADFEQVFVLTNENNEILQISDMASFDVMAGAYFAYGINYEIAGGIQNLTEGSLLSDVTAACIDITAPFYFVVCPSPGTCDYEAGDISFSAAGQNTEAEYTQVYLLTDLADNILQISETTTFADVVAGMYKIYGLNYLTDGGINNLSVGNNKMNISGGCLDFSNVYIFEVCGGLCCTYTEGDVVFAANNFNADAEYTQVFVLVNDSGQILQISNSSSFTEVAAGTYYAYALNYLTSGGIENLAEGSTLNEVTGECFDFSAPYIFEVCPVIPEECCNYLEIDTIVLTTGGFNAEPGYTQVYLLTTPDGQILTISETAQFDPQAPGNYTAYGFNYLTGGAINNLTVGANISEITGDCFDFSNAYVFVVCDAECEDIIFEATINDAICEEANGSIAINVTADPDATLFNYAWSNGETTNNISGLVADTYTLTISNPARPDCPTVVDTFTINNIPTPVVTVDAVEVALCGSPGSINLSIDAANPVDISWTGTTDGSASAVATTAFAIEGMEGMYEITVTDTATACTTTVNAEILAEEATPINVDAWTFADADCPGGLGVVTFDGSADANNVFEIFSIVDGDTTSVLTVAGNATLDTGLTAGNYLVVRTNTTNTCEASVNISISEPTALVALFNVMPNTNCDEFNGVIELVEVQGYSFSEITLTVSNSDNEIQTNLTGLAPGAYNVRVGFLDGECSEDYVLTIENEVICVPTTATLGFTIDQNTTLDTCLDTFEVPGNNEQAAESCDGSNTTSNGGALTFTDNCVNYEPATDFVGTDEFCVVICNDAIPAVCDTTFFIIVVEATNTQPFAIDDTYFTFAETEFDGNVTDNDIDIDGDALSVSLVNSVSNGTLTLNADGTFTYTPNADFVGVDSFTYEVCDDGAPTLCDQASVSILVQEAGENIAPIAVDDIATGLDTEIITGDVLNNDFDIDGDNIAINIVAIEAPNNGFVNINPDGTFEYIPDLGFDGLDSFVYEICDDGEPSLCATATVTILVIAEEVEENTPPIANDDVVSTMQGESVNGNVLTNDSDLDGDNLSVEMMLLSFPSNGVAFVNADGSFTYTPFGGFVGVDSFTYQVCDDGEPSLCATATVTVVVQGVVENNPPIASNDVFATNEGENVTGSLTANDQDLDGDNITISTTPIFDASNGSVTINADGTFTYIPDDGFVGTDSFTYQICDDGEPVLCATATATIIVSGTGVVNNPPSANDDLLSVVSGGMLENECVICNDTDVDGDNLTISVTAVNEPLHGILTINADGTFTYTSNEGYVGLDSFTYEVCDDGDPSLCATATVLIDVSMPTIDPECTSYVGQACTSVGVAVDVCPTFCLAGDYNIIDVNAIYSSSVSINNECVNYDPLTGFEGTEIIEITACDAFGNCDIAYVFITVAATPGDCDPTVGCQPFDFEVCIPMMTPIVVCPDYCIEGAIEVTDISSDAGNAVQLLDNGCVQYTPLPDFTGQDILTVFACDENGNCEQAIVSLNVVMDLADCEDVSDPGIPVAVDDNAISTNGGTIDIFVLNNDSDPNGDEFGITSFTQPLNGTVLLSDGIFTYTPANGFEGLDFFTYQICDVNGNCDIATVFVEVSGDCNEIQTICAEPVQPVQICPEFCDLNGVISITSVQSVFTCSLQSEDDGDACFIYTALPLFSGADTLTISACDNFGFCETIDIVINVTDDCETTPGGTTGGGTGNTTADGSNDDDREDGKLGDANELAFDNLVLSSISPVPAKEQINVRFTTNTEQVRLLITDLSGKLIRSEDIAAAKGINNITTDIANLPVGMYMLSLQSNKAMVNAKFIKE